MAFPPSRQFDQPQKVIVSSPQQFVRDGLSWPIEVVRQALDSSAAPSGRRLRRENEEETYYNERCPASKIPPEDPMTRQLDRRRFLQTSAALFASGPLMPAEKKVSANDCLQLAVIGVAAQGSYDLHEAANAGAAPVA